MIQTAPSLTGFMRAEVKRKKEEDQSGATDYTSQNTIIQEDEAVNHGYSEEFMSGAGQQQPQDQLQVENNEANDEDDLGSGGGLPMRLPTEIMNTPPPDHIEPVENEPYTETTTEEAMNENESEQQQLNVNEVEDDENVKIKSLESEYAALDMEIAQQYYYLTEKKYKMGPFTMDEIAQKYKSEDVNDETLIWSGNETNEDAKPLKQNERIYSNLPKPPKRRPAQGKKVKKKEEHEVVASRSPSPAPPTQEDSSSQPAAKSGGCCIVM